MKHISNIVNMESASTKGNGKKNNKPDCPKTSRLIDEIFGFFYAICRGFEKQYQDPKRLNVEKTQWRAAFQDLSINERSQIEFGIKRARLESPINTPTIKQFIAWCTPTPQQLGLPSYDHAFDEACKNSHPLAKKIWTHDVVYYAWSKTGSYELCNSPAASIRPKFEKYYKEAVKLHTQGKVLRQIENKKEETYELEKRKDVVKDEFKEVKGHKQAMEVMRKMLR